MQRRGTTSSLGTRSPAVVDMIERLALAACGSVLWTNPYAREYHRAAVRRMIAVMTVKDLTTIKGLIGE